MWGSRGYISNPGDVAAMSMLLKRVPFIVGLAVLASAALVRPCFAQLREPAAAVTEPGHRALLRIPPGGPLPMMRKVTIGADKSMLIEVPVDLENVMVSNPEILDAVVQTSRQIYLLAKDVGEANAFFLGSNGQKVLLLEVSIVRDLSTLNDALSRLLPGSKVNVEPMGDNVVLTGSVLNAVDANRAAELSARFIKKKIDNVVNMLTVAPPAKEQVLLKVRVAEMQRDAIRRLGVNLQVAGVTAGKFIFDKVVTNAFPVTAPGVPLGSAGTEARAMWATNGKEVSALVESLERTGLVRTLAEPNLTALSGEKATFLAGGEFPVPVASQDRTITIQFKKFGVSTEFKPVVLSDGRISLSISSEVSELSTEGAITVSDLVVPALKTRRAETTLEMPSGGTLAMAGLLSDDTRQSVEGVPGLKNLPVLGQLFRSNDYRRNETELVILVTPYIATHMAADQAARPDQGFAPPHDLKSLFFGHINRIYGPPGREPPGRYQGDYGFIVEYPGVKG
jgi:pilus assembly protein CpaC